MPFRHALPASILAVLVLQGLFVALGDFPLLGPDGDLAGPDGYMRLMQVERLWASWDWYDRLSPLTNAPRGETLHWTRPFDLLLVAGALPLMYFMEANEAIRVWGLAVSPVLQVATLLVVWWGVRGIMGPWTFALFAVLFCLQPVSRSYFLIARPDHHSLQLFLFFVGVAGLMRLTRVDARPELATILGVFAGVGLWVSPEGLLAVLVANGALGIMWLMGDGRHLGLLVRYGWGLAFMTALALAFDKPPMDFMAIQYDQISIVHATLTMAMATGWTVAMAVAGEGGLGRRLVAGLVAAAIPAGVMAALFPDFFKGPYVHVDPYMHAEWLKWISEVKPLIGSEPEIIAKAVFVLGPGLLAGGWSLWRLAKRLDVEERGLHVLFLVAFAIFLPLSLYQVRWSAYTGAMMVIPWAMMLAAIMEWDGALRVAGRAVPLRSLAFLLALLGNFVVGGAVLSAVPEKPEEDEKEKPTCRWAVAADWIKGLADAKGRRLVLMPFVHQGPEVAYRTGQGVVGSPYQRNLTGVRDTHRVMGSLAPDEARAVVFARRVDYLMLCRHGKEANRYVKDADKPTLVARAFRGDLPGWLRPVETPPDIAEIFVVLEPVK